MVKAQIFIKFINNQRNVSFQKIEKMNFFKGLAIIQLFDLEFIKIF